MKNWFSIPNKIVLSKPYRSWGQSFKDNAFLAKIAYQYFRKDRELTAYERAVQKYGILLSKHAVLVQKPFYDEKLMEHVKKHIKGFRGFQTEGRTYFVTGWNPIYGEEEWTGGVIVTMEKELYQRDRLLQLFKSCDPGSYGYYAYRGLSPVKFFVQSFASAQIDQFFASNAQFIAQPFGPFVDNIMTTLETAYWNTRPRSEVTDYIAGQVIGQKQRSDAVRLASVVSRFLEGIRYSPLPDGRELTEAQWNEIGQILRALVAQVDEDSLQGIVWYINDIYDKMVQKNKEQAKLTPLLEDPSSKSAKE
jgi:hypothetical protein